MASPIDPFTAPDPPHPPPQAPHVVASGSKAAAAVPQAGTIASQAHAAVANLPTVALPQQPSLQAHASTTNADGRRKKKPTRRVGYARDDTAEAAPVKAAQAKPSAAPATAVLQSPTPPPMQVASVAAAAPTAQAAAPPSEKALKAAPLAATHTTAALLDIVSSAPSMQPTPSSPAPMPPVATQTSSRPAQESKHASLRHQLPKADASYTQTATQAQARGSPRSAAKSGKAAKAAAQPLTALVDLLPIVVPAMTRQDSRGAMPLSPQALVQVTYHRKICKVY